MPDHENTGTAKILVVDDDSDALFIAKHTLQTAGYEVETADNIWIAHQVGTFRPDLILMDIRFRNFENGPVAVKALKKNQLGSQTTVLLYSTMAETELAALVIECGADGYVSKQAGPPSLLHETRRHLRMQALRRGCHLAAAG